MVVNASFWHGRRVFLTGHTGFKGSWLSLWLQSLGAELTGYALTPPTTPSLFELARVGDGMRSTEGDVRNLELLARMMEEARPEIVIHMAAQSLVRYSYESPVETYATNVIGTVNIHEAARACSSVRAVINVTTDKCYENREWVWGYRESDRLGGYDPYSSSKACSELVSAAYRSSFFSESGQKAVPVAVATVRAGNVIGGGDWATDRLIPDIISAFERGGSALIRNPRAVRPWQHVLEPLRGYLMLSEKLIEHGRDYAQAWNFGPESADSKPVSWVVNEMAKRWGDKARWHHNSSEQPHEAAYLKLDISKARDLLHWSPKLTLGDTLGLVINWYRAISRGEDARDLTVSQIKSYQEATQI